MAERARSKPRCAKHRRSRRSGDSSGAIAHDFNNLI